MWKVYICENDVYAILFYVYMRSILQGLIERKRRILRNMRAWHRYLKMEEYKSVVIQFIIINHTVDLAAGGLSNFKN